MPKLIEVRSWLPEHHSGQKSATLGGHVLPSEVGATLQAEWRILCLAPAQWLLIAEQSPPEPAEPGLVLTDATGAFAVLEVRGVLARDLLSKSCGLDFEPRTFPLGRCARTRLAQALVIVDCVDDEPRFDLYVPRSYRRFVSDWLEDAAVEFSGSLP